MNTRDQDTIDSSFRISDAPVVDANENGKADSDVLPELPRSYGHSIVFAMPRDPKTIFVYWDIDWPKIFAAAAPAERKVYLRVHDPAQPAVSETVVEPMSRSCEIAVAPGRSYEVEIGYFDQMQVWCSVGQSQVVKTPMDKIGALSPGDFALVPFHITFQRLTELFRATQIDEGSLVQSLTRLQEKSLHPEEFGSLAPEEQEVYRAMKASVSEKTYLPRVPLNRTDEMRLQKKLESVLGFGARPSSHSLGGSSKV